MNNELMDCYEMLPLEKSILDKKYWVKRNGEIFLEYTDGVFFMNHLEFYFVSAIYNLEKKIMIEYAIKWIEKKIKIKPKTVIPIKYLKKI